MSAKVKRATYRRSCRSCPWTGTYDTAGRADYAKRRHDCAKHQAKADAAERGRARLDAVDRTPKPCHHKHADHQHGTYACYTLDGCRCEPCRVAVREYEQNRVRQQAYGRWDNLIDAAPTRAHVRRLMAAGMGLKRVGAAADVSTGVMWKLLYGKPGKGGNRTPSRRVTKAVAARLLAVELDLADGALVSGADTSRRLQALVANGWSMSKLGARLGILPGNFGPVVNGTRPDVTVATAKAVHALYRELVDTAPPEDEWRERIAASRARNHAARNGWTPPLRIGGRALIGPALPLPEDDYEDSDDLVAESFDEAAVQRRLSGDHTAAVKKAERVEIVARARAAGWSLREIEERAGITQPTRYLDQPAENTHHDTQEAS